MTIEKCITTKQKMDLNVIGVTIPTVQDINELPEELIYIDHMYWLQDKGYGNRFATIVDQYGRIEHNGISVDHALGYYGSYGVRPILFVEDLNGLAEGDEVEVAGYRWTVISRNRLLCNIVVEVMAFRTYKEINDDTFVDYEHVTHPIEELNNYEFSDVKSFLEHLWAHQHGFEFSPFKNGIFENLKQVS